MTWRSLATWRSNLAVLNLLIVFACGGGEPTTQQQDGSHQPGDDGGADASAGADAHPDAGIVDRDGGVVSDGAGADVAPPPSLDLRIEGGFVRKALALPDGRVLALVEPPLHLRVDFGRPRRELRWVRPDGGVERAHASPAGKSLLDFARHPSGLSTLLLASEDGYHLERLDAQGTPVLQAHFADDKVATDPPLPHPMDPAGAIDPYHRDGGRVVAAGEEVGLALRNGRHSVVYYRVAFADGAPVTRQRVLAVPPVRIWPIALTGGSYDTFGQLESRYGVTLAMDDYGTAYVGVRASDLAELRLRKAFRDVFGETLEGDPDGMDGYVVRIAADGRRLGTSVVGTAQEDELYGLSASGGAAWAVGRSELWNERGTGHDVLLARIDGVTGAVHVRVLDVDRGDIAFDAAATPTGVMVVGASGYSQNPRGASISEESTAFARFVPPEGPVLTIPLPTSPRHNEARLVLPRGDGRFMVGGMLDGPGTHTADADAALLRARGFLVDVTIR